MNPSADVRALASIRVDVADVEPGTQLTVKWLGKPVFIRRRTEEEIAEARQVALGDLATLNHATKTCQGLTHLTKTAA
jgi:ubiquinol-cytochrome c reductase iron-sulfur subunit